jgi:hypothetical protein
MLNLLQYSISYKISKYFTTRSANVVRAQVLALFDWAHQCVPSTWVACLIMSGTSSTVLLLLRSLVML